MEVSASPSVPARLKRRGIRLEWATNGWNVIEVIATISLGIQAHSLALIAFGLDSIVEIFASSVVIQNLGDARSDPGDRRIHRTLRRIAVAFWLLAAFLLAASIRGLVVQSRPESSPIGIGYMSLTAVVMFLLAALKWQTARRIGSETLAAEAKMSVLDGTLSTGVLAALVLNTALAWWWTDSGATIIVAGFAVAAGFGNWLGSTPHDEEQ